MNGGLEAACPHTEDGSRYGLRAARLQQNVPSSGAGVPSRRSGEKRAEGSPSPKTMFMGRRRRLEGCVLGSLSLNLPAHPYLTPRWPCFTIFACRRRRHATCPCPRLREPFRRTPNLNPKKDRLAPRRQGQARRDAWEENSKRTEMRLKGPFVSLLSSHRSSQLGVFARGLFSDRR